MREAMVFGIEKTPRYDISIHFEELYDALEHIHKFSCQRGDIFHEDCPWPLDLHIMIPKAGE